MENPKSFHRFLIGLVIFCTTVAIGLSVYLGELIVLFIWLGALAFILAIFGVLALVNVAVFAPILLLIGKLMDKKSENKSRGSDKHTT